MKTKFKILNVLLLILLSPLFLFAQSTQLTGGNNFSVGLCGSGSIYAWGSNTSGQVGQGTLTTTQYTSPTAVLGFPGGLKFSQVNAGSGAHALALDCNKNVWSWGENQCGQTGNGGSTASCGTASVPQATPSKVVGGAQGGAFLSNIVSIGGGNNFSMGIESGTGKVYSWGENTLGELGNNSTVASSTPVIVQKCSPAGALTNIVMIQGGDQTAYALDASGKVWAWGDNSNHNLGNGAANSSCAIAVTTSTGAQLKGIKMIAAGDTHGMALDSTGQVWTWGGDWGPGQLGQGTTFITNAYASRVVAPNNFAATGSSGPYITNAIYIAAGQASSTVVLSDGSVVAFGAYGLYPGPVCGAGTLLFSGTLGTGHQAPNNATCNSNGNRGTSYPPAANTSGYGTPEYVMINGTTKLGNTSPIVSVARGDGWYFAIDASGATYAWGFNGANGAIASIKGGELGIGNTTDQAFAVPVTLPVGCGTISTPCPLKPGLGPDMNICPASAYTLNSNESGTGAGYTYTWLSSSTGTVGSYTTLGGATSPTYTATMASSVIYYVVQVDAASACGACPTVSDTIKVSPILAPYTGTGTFCATNPNVQFTVNGTGKYKWYFDQQPVATLPSGGTVTYIAGTSNTITLPKTNANTSFGALCPYALFVTDTSTYPGTLLPAASMAGAPCGGTGATESGDRSPLMITAYQNMLLTSLDIIVPNHGYVYNTTYVVEIYNDNPTGANCPNPPCNPSGNKNGRGATLLYSSAGLPFSATGGPTQLTIPLNYTLTGSGGTPVNYWIQIKNGSEVTYFNGCTPAFAANTNLWSTGYWDNTGSNVLHASTSYHDNNYSPTGGTSHMFNIKFNVGSPYTCSRLQVCATSGACPLPVNIIAFTAQKEPSSILLEWTTASEQNTSYFEVQRSDDGVNFTAIGKVSAAGNSNNLKNYSYTDNSSETSGIIYYRLQEYDKDGKSNLSGIQSVSTGKVRDIKIIPNPNAGKFNVILERDPTDVHIVLLSTLGEELLQINNNNSDNSIDIQNLASGVYFLHVRTSSGSWIKKVVKQ
jgi:alpha-tubulin suppressor-like RCC1 family protein